MAEVQCYEFKRKLYISYYRKTNLPIFNKICQAVSNNIFITSFMFDTYIH